MHYWDEEDNIEIKTAKTTDGKTYGDVIQTSNEIEEVDGYIYHRADKDSLTIGNDENVINLYYNKRTDLQYVVHYYKEGTTTKVAEDKQGTPQEYKATVTENAIEVEGYTPVNPTTKSIEIQTGTNEIIFYYRPKSNLGYVVHYYKEGTTDKVAEDKNESSQTFGEEITEEAIDIEGYTKVDPTTQTITIQETGNEIIFYYKLVDGLSYIVYYVDADSGEEIHDRKEQDGVDYGTIITAAEEVMPISGYNYYGVDKDSLTITEGVNELTIFYTRRTDIAYTVNYYEKNTTNKLIDSKEEIGTFGEEITAESVEETIPGYNYDSASEYSIILKESDNNIDLFYTRRNDIPYIIHYRKNITEEELAPDKQGAPQTYGATVRESAIDIPGYKKINPTTVEIEIQLDGNEYTFYYEESDELSFKVRHYEKGTTNEVYPEETIENQTLGDEIISENYKKTGSDVQGFSYDSTDKPTLTISSNEEENIITLYYVRNTYGYTVQRRRNKYTTSR